MSFCFFFSVSTRRRSWWRASGAYWSGSSPTNSFAPPPVAPCTAPRRRGRGGGPRLQPGFQVRHTTHNTRHTTLSFLGRGRERQGEAVGRGGERDGDAVPRSVVRRRLLDPSHAAPDVEKALVELHGVLKPGGRLVICQADMDTRTRVYSSGTHHRTRAHVPRTLHTITTTPGWNICRPGTGARPGEGGE